MVFPIFDIKRYSINDGPGIRVTVFFKGCPLSCVWCHNPEGISPKQSKLYTIGKCIACESCVRACPKGALTPVQGKGIVTDFDKCVMCGACARACPTKAMEMAIKNYSLEEIMAEIEKERPFFEISGGGVTFCGGEPLLQKERLLVILEECGRRGIHRVVDTTLFAQPDFVLQVADRCELFLVDLKHMDSEKHRFFCGVPNELIHSNIRMLSEKGYHFIIRIPLIDHVNSDEENILASARFLASLKGEKPLVELLPYHDIAKGKHARLGTTYNPEQLPMAEPSPEVIARTIEIFKNEGIRATS